MATASTWYLDFKSAKSDGTLPLDKPARAMRYKRAIIWRVNVSIIGISGRTAKGSWTIVITDETGAIVYFKQKVTILLMVIYLGNAGISLFTWSYVRDEFDSSVVGTVETTKENIGQFLQGKTATSEQGLFLPGGGTDYTDQTATIIADWLSPVYLFKSPGRPLPPRAKVKITKDEWGFGPASVEYGWAFDEATPTPVNTLVDRLGSMVVGNSGTGIGREGTGAVHVARSWPLDSFLNLDRDAPFQGDYPTFHELEDGRLLACALVVDGVAEYVSHTSGLSWEPVKYLLPDHTLSSPARVFSAGIDMPTSLKIDETTRLHIAVRSGKLVYSVVDDAGPTPEMVIGALPDDDTSLPSLERGSDGIIYIIGGKGIPIYRTVTLPPQWEHMNGGLT